MQPMPHATHRPRKTVEDYLSLPDDVRAELIAGELYVIPAPEVGHQRVVFRVARGLAEHVERHDVGEVIPSPMDVHLPTGDVVQPDVVFVAKANRGVIQRWIHGAPDLVIEVLSPLRPERDRFVKRVLYERNGVPEYWIVDLEDRSVQVLELEGEAYREAGWYQAGESFTSQTLPALELDVASFFRDLP